MKTNQSRRDFLRLAAAGAAGAVVLSNFSCKPKAAPAQAAAPVDPKSFGIGLQLYTIRDAMAVDVPGSLKKVSDLGYKYLELAGYAGRKFYGYEPAEFLKLVNDLGMEVLSSHTQVEAEGITLENAKFMAEDHAKLGVKYCVQPWVVPEARNTIASYQKMVADWNKVGAIMKEVNIQFGYHNHNFEFATVEGKIPFFDVFMTELDKDLVTMELDMFWTTKAGQNPVEIIKKYPGRFQLFHMKDMFTNEPPFFTTDGVADFAPVGAGVINFKEILAVKDIAGMKYMIVEQDSTKDGLPFDAIKTSITNLTTKILV
ncbi:MAG: sugar phosphate isomerase/epimerase [Bacteroidales bacterium]|jgi:sugar phosphate isomerase/epimerase|nr:sugar phosphate isomerase/epimerase [Bacteroidales bacterium]